VDAAAQELQAHEFAQRKRSQVVDTHPVFAKGVWLVVVGVVSHASVAFGERLSVGLGEHGYVQQTWGGLAELA
jgi:hypothetical protein